MPYFKQCRLAESLQREGFVLPHVIVAMLLLFALAPATLSAQENATLLYEEETATWFEDIRVHGDLSPDGRWLVLADWRFRKAIDRVTGETVDLDAVAPPNDLDRVFGVRFLRDGRVALYGRRGKQAGWFLPEADEYEYTDLPRRATLGTRRGEDGLVPGEWRHAVLEVRRGDLCHWPGASDSGHSMGAGG